MNKTEPTAATEGTTFVVSEYRGGERVKTTYTVGKKCDTNHGAWICTTHPSLGAFRNQMMKDAHAGRAGKHVLAWVCVFHGPEVP